MVFIKRTSHFRKLQLKIIAIIGLMFLFVACGGDESSKISEPEKDSLEESTSEKSSSSVDSKKETKSSSSSVQKDSCQNFILCDVSITGLAQKGPFAVNSPINLREYSLKNKELISSGRTFTDKILSNKGDFAISNINMVYPYAVLEVKGSWRNEFTGRWSKDSMTLRVLTDLSKRTEVNANLLTHLEYDRVVKLIKKGSSISAAKKKAEQEIMEAFGFPVIIDAAEDLVMFVNPNDELYWANAALLACSILVLSNHQSYSEIYAFIDSLKKDFAVDGTWDDERTKATLADWALGYDYSNIRAIIKKWNVSDIPNFEKMLEKFWGKIYGLGECMKERYGVVVQNQNKYSKNKDSYYICKTDKWREATEAEKIVNDDTYGWKEGKEGELRTGKVNKDKYYLFDGELWREATDVEIDTYGWKDGEEGDVRVGNVNKDRYYMYARGEWVISTDEFLNKFGICVASREGEKKVLDNDYFICESENWKRISAQEYGLGYCTTVNEGLVGKVSNIYYICKSKKWTEATILEYDTYGLTASKNGEVKNGVVDEKNYYVYENGIWRKSENKIEDNIGACTVERDGEKGIVGGKYYICESCIWKKISVEEYNLGFCTEDNNGDLIKWHDAYFVCDEGMWQTSGYCTENNNGKVVMLDNNYYICNSNEWIQVTMSEGDLYGFVCSKNGEILLGNIIELKNKYVCDADTFRKASEREINLDKGCTSYTRNDQIHINVSKTLDRVYTCDHVGWQESFGTIVVYDSLVDERDQNVYKTVRVGNQVWMAENLRLNHNLLKFNGTSLCGILPEPYGCFYTWSAAMDSAGIFSTKGNGCGYGEDCNPRYPVQGICPNGWHIPTTADWDTLFAVAKEAHLGLNAYGFSVSYAGYSPRGLSTYKDHFEIAYLWTSTPAPNLCTSKYVCAYYAHIYDSKNFGYSENTKDLGFSVRCIQD